MIGTVLDAHPDMVVAHEYFLFDKCSKMLKKGTLLDKPALFNAIFANSYLTSKCGWRSDVRTRKGYNFNFDFEWQGKFKVLRVIGDKSGGSATHSINTKLGLQCLKDLSSLNLSLTAIHVVRNPYDMIATTTQLIPDKTSHNMTIRNATESTLFNHAKVIFHSASIIHKFIKMAPKFGISILEVHTEDYIEDPPSIVRRMCSSLGVDCSQGYVDKCANRKVSRSRDLLRWSLSVVSYVRKEMKKFPFFKGYTFENDFREI